MNTLSNPVSTLLVLAWERECVSAWAAQSVSRLHQQLGALDVKHAIRIEAPEAPRGEQLPLV
jgi:hypothetical protein